MNIVELLSSTVERLPDNPAIHFKNEILTYKELHQKVFQAAAALRSLGVKESTNVALMMSNRPEYIITYFALLANGATVVPINPLFKEQEVTYILNDSESEFLIIEELSRQVIENVRHQFQSIKEIIYYGDQELSGYLNWKELLQHSPSSQPVQRKSMDTAQIIYTSGTTGNPKGAMISHSNLNWMAITSAVFSEIKPGDRILCVLPLFHAYAKLQGFLSPISHGATIYLEERFEPVSILDSIASHKITVFLGVPTMYAMFVQSPNITELDFSNLRIAGSGGASIPVEIIEKANRLMGVEIAEGYGMTESTVMLTATPASAEKKHGSVGLPLPGVDLKIIDPEGNTIPPKAVGEIVFRGPNAMKGYYKKPQETENTIKNGWLYTGDLAYQDEDGYIFIVDRKKDLIIRGGYNVYPREIEEILYTHREVVECAVIGRPDPLLGEKIVAYIVTKTSQNEKDLQDFCKEKLVHYKVPDYISFIDQLPKSGTGKILKTALKKQDKNFA
ncbi:class I adenylate-forming enzyme family protein [Bacillus sp. V59.32b]|uniref:class I adenylate-forming enzyme family protein n=1 Tax=Bacillus sp. V59.32b TaxID=1758642 RepID=UPI000E3DAA97|nr:long-chain fatty acid--CoA ligase [Bacillus sp. V59.32b]RFU61179.1 long-chain fatty acid--CoA ligase [Bacillus sp. V59.32b]